ncbi:pseudouridine synthase [Spirulina sp. CS-785/01]|uniref:pseudouridine synthase n=1 Tax=Spirulina sp. CS-785/01 TaxID=3021716 RepID=UPI003FA6BC12
MPERVQKILSQWGIASRRQAEKMILAGRVQLNGQVVQLGQKADPQADHLQVDGQPLTPKNRPSLVYILLNKPLGVVSTCADPQGRTTVLDCLPPHLRQGQGLHPVGRLDADSTGAILLTNDGQLTLALTHPRYHLPKTYQVRVAGHPSQELLQQWRQGVKLSGKYTLPAQIEILSAHGPNTVLRITLEEGRNRQIRRIAEQLGHPVLQLHRLSIGPLHLNEPPHPKLRSGDYRFLSPAEIDHCFAHCSL